jgi:hypothetical protein
MHLPLNLRSEIAVRNNQVVPNLRISPQLCAKTEIHYSDTEEATNFVAPPLTRTALFSAANRYLAYREAPGPGVAPDLLTELAVRIPPLS